MSAAKGKCYECGQDVYWAAYQRDLTRTSPTGRRAAKIPFDTTPAADDDEQVVHALSAGKTSVHKITEDWPLLTSQGEKRYVIHYATCPARGAARRGVGAAEVTQ